MATQIQTRKQRGDKIAPEDIVELNPSSFFVKSQSHGSGYSVTRVGRDWTCDCPDHGNPGASSASTSTLSKPNIRLYRLGRFRSGFGRHRNDRGLPRLQLQAPKDFRYREGRAFRRQLLRPRYTLQMQGLRVRVPRIHRHPLAP